MASQYAMNPTVSTQPYDNQISLQRMFSNRTESDMIEFKLNITVDYGTDGLGIAYAIDDEVMANQQ